MLKPIADLFELYLDNIIENCHYSSGISKKSITLTHVLPNQIKYFHALNKIVPIKFIIAVPYSINQSALDILRQDFCILTPTFAELTNEQYLADVLLESARNDEVIIQEIGGYFAKTLHNLSPKISQRILGVVEDTEDGHRSYERVNGVHFPVISIARSSLKKAEDALVGGSCMFSTEKLLREFGVRIEGKKAFVLGYGKVGRGLAYALQRRSCSVGVYDIDPIRRIQALSDGFAIPDKIEALKNAEIIFGAAGKCTISKEDFTMIRKGAFLVSCSSKQKEFDLVNLKQQYSENTVAKNIACYRNMDHFFYLLAEGYPVNFLDSSAIGPTIALTHAEMLVAIQKILSGKCHPGLQQLDEEMRQVLATKWLKYFVNPLLFCK